MKNCVVLLLAASSLLALPLTGNAQSIHKAHSASRGRAAHAKMAAALIYECSDLSSQSERSDCQKSALRLPR